MSQTKPHSEINKEHVCTSNPWMSGVAVLLKALSNISTQWPYFVKSDSIYNYTTQTTFDYFEYTHTHI